MTRCYICLLTIPFIRTSRLDAHLPSLFIALAVLAVIVFFESFASRFPAFRRRHDRCQRLFIQSDCHLRQICSQMCPPFSRHTVPRLDSPSTDRNRLASVAYCPGCRAPWECCRIPGFRWGRRNHLRPDRKGSPVRVDSRDSGLQPASLPRPPLYR